MDALKRGGSLPAWCEAILYAEEFPSVGGPHIAAQMLEGDKPVTSNLIPLTPIWRARWRSWRKAKQQAQMELEEEQKFFDNPDNGHNSGHGSGIG